MIFSFLFSVFIFIPDDFFSLFTSLCLPVLIVFSGRFILHSKLILVFCLSFTSVFYRTIFY